MATDTTTEGLERDIAALRKLLDGFTAADWRDRTPAYADLLSAIYGLTEIDPVWEEAQEVAAENGLEWDRDSRGFVERQAA